MLERLREAAAEETIDESESSNIHAHGKFFDTLNAVFETKLNFQIRPLLRCFTAVPDSLDLQSAQSRTTHALPDFDILLLGLLLCYSILPVTAIHVRNSACCRCTEDA